MPRRRSRYLKNYAHPAQCPHCQGLLSRLSGQRYTIDAIAQSDLHRYGQLVITGGEGAGQARRWLEEFYCPGDGRIWMTIECDDRERLKVTVADPKLWKRAVGVDPVGNPSVSQFTAQESRGCRVRS